MAVTFMESNLALVPARYVPPAVGTRNERSPSHPIQVAFVGVVAALLKAGWDVPGVDVEFGTAGAGSDVQRSVLGISGRTTEGPFAVQTSGRYGVCRAVIPPGVEATFDGPDSYPRIAYLDGTPWTDEPVGSATERRDPRSLAVVRYRYASGGYALDGDGLQDHEREAPDVDRVLDQVGRFLEALEARLLAWPAAPGYLDVTEEGDANLRRLVARDPLPVPEGFPALYSWVGATEANMIVDPGARRDDGSNDYVLTGNGGRVVPLGGRPFDGRETPRDAYRGFSYASADPDVRARQSIASEDGLFMPVVVRLKRLDEVFVVDNARFALTRIAVLERVKAQGRNRMTDRELDSCMAEVGLTMVPATAYDGSYAEPTYLIGRQLGPEEARLASGPVSHTIDGNHERVVLSDADGAVTLFDDPNPSRSERERAKSVAADAKRLSAMARFPFRYVRPLPETRIAEPEREALVM